MKGNFHVVLILLLLCIGVMSEGQTQCVVPDSINQMNRGTSAHVVRNYLLNNDLPEKDLFSLPDSLIQRTTNVLNAVWLNDTIEGHDTIYDSLSMWFLSPYMNGGLVYESNIIHFDTSSIHYKNFLNSKVSGDPYFDGLISRYANSLVGYPRTNGIYIGVILEGFFNLKPFLDSLEDVSWIDSAQVLTRSNRYFLLGEREGAYYSIHYVGDTTYIQYMYMFGDCGLGCTNEWVWNYKVLPDCTVEFLGRNRLTIPTPQVLGPFKVITCLDSIWVGEKNIPYDLFHSSLSFEWSGGLGSHVGMVYESGNYFWLWLDTNGLLYQKRLYEVEFVDRPDVNFNDTVLCNGEVYFFDTNDSIDFWLVDEHRQYWVNPDSLTKSGNYTFNIMNCLEIDTFQLAYVDVPEFQKQYFKCHYDSVKIVLPSGLDSFTWDFGLQDSVTLSDTGVFHVDMNIQGCGYQDSIIVQNYRVLPFDIGKDTAVGTGVVFEFELDSQFHNVLWQDGDSAYYKWYRSNLMGYGSHEFNVSALDSNGCFYTDSFSILVKNYASFKGIVQEDVLVYPNPFIDEVYVPKSQLGDEFRIYNNVGVLVRKGQIKFDRKINNLKHLESGAYYLILDNSAVFKMIK